MRPRHRNRQGLVHRVGAVTPLRSRGLKPGERALDAQWIRGRHQLRTALAERCHGVTEVGLGEQYASARAHRRQIVSARRREKVHIGNTELREVAAELLFDNVSQCANHHEALGTLGRRRQVGHHTRQTLILTLSKRGFDTRATEGGNAESVLMDPLQPSRRIGEVELDHLGRAGTHEEKPSNIGAARQQFGNHPIEFFVAIRHAGQIPLTKNRGRETRLCKNHDARRGLQQVGAGAGPHDEEERVLNPAMQPNDRGQAAEDRPLTPFGGDLGLRLGISPCNHLTHDSSAPCVPITVGVAPRSAAEVCLAAWNLSRNCSAFKT